MSDVRRWKAICTFIVDGTDGWVPCATMVEANEGFVSGTDYDALAAEYGKLAPVAIELRGERDALAAELATWKRECGPLLNYLTGSETICSQPVDYANEQIGSLQARLAEAERDAGRYRWLRGETAKGPVDGKANIEMQDPNDDCAVDVGHTPDDLDAAIDGWMGTTDRNAGTPAGERRLALGAARHKGVGASATDSADEAQK